MVRVIQLLCGSICLVTAISSPAQTLPEKTVAEEVVGNSLHEQKKWELKQLPRNSVLYKYQSPSTTFDPAPYGLKNEKLAGLNLPGAQPQVTAHQHNIYLQSYLKEERRQDLPGKKKYWWSETGINSSHKIFPDSKNN